MQGEVNKLKELKAEADEQIKLAKAGRKDGEERENLMVMLKELERTFATKSEELEQFKEMDPDLFEQKSKCVN